MNTTARIESSSATGRIHVSQATAQLLKESGKEHWLVPRQDRIQAKGKGQLTTYWVEVNEKANSTGMSSNEGTSVGDSAPEDEEEQRLIEWNVEMLSRLVKQVVARRQAAGVDASSVKAPLRNPEGPKTIPLDEVKEIISLPEFDPSIAAKQVPAEDIVLEPQVVQQLHDYGMYQSFGERWNEQLFFCSHESLCSLVSSVTAVAYLYHHNPFHNLAHASHVVMSVIKLMSRIVAPEAFHDNNDCKPEDNVAQSMHDHTYGITSDPLTQFACAFSALIHVSSSLMSCKP